MKQDVIERYLAGENTAVLAADAGMKEAAIYSAIKRRGRQFERWALFRNGAADVADRLCQIALDTYGVNIRARDRRHGTALVKQAVMLVMHRDGHSYPNIAAALHLGDHTTVIHGVRVAKGCMERLHIAKALTAALGT